MVNLKATSTPIRITNYYYREYEKKLIKMTNMESELSSSSSYSIIPYHTYKQLKNANRLKDRLFVLECKFDIKEDNIIKEKKCNIYFQLVDEKTFNDYKIKYDKKKKDDNNKKQLN